MREVLVLVVLTCLGTASLMAASIVPRLTSSERLLFAYLLAWAQLALWPIALTPFDALAPSGLVVIACVSLALAAAAWTARGRPGLTAPSRQVGRQALHHVKDPFVATLATCVVLVYAYLAIVGLGLPQNDGDPLVYQLTRAALWRQQQSVGLVGDGVELRLDGNPPVAELGMSVWLTVGGERFVWIGQYTASLALSLGVFGLATRAGLAAREAALSSLIVPTLAVVAVQSPTAYTDVVVASFLVAAAVFASGRAPAHLVGLTLGSGLAVGTKFSGALLLPLLIAIVLSVQPARRWVACLFAISLGAVVGSSWYLASWKRTGSFSGGIAEDHDQIPELSVSGVLLRLQRLSLDAWDISGFQGVWPFAYALLAVALMFVGFRVSRSKREPEWGYAMAGAAVVLLPLLVTQAHGLLAMVFASFWDILGDDAATAALHGSVVSREADGADSWFGVVFAPMAVAALTASSWAVIHRRLPLMSMTLALAPVLAGLIVAAAIVYDPWRGRFFIAAAAMSVASWGTVTRIRWVAVVVCVASTVSLVSTVATWKGKPTGIALLDGRSSGSVWTASRWEAQTLLRGYTPHERGEMTVIEQVEKLVPPNATIALRLGWNDFRFPAFGGSLGRRVVLVRAGEQLPSNAQWAVLAPSLTALRCDRAWRSVISAEGGWRLLQRRATDRVCP